MGELRFKDSRKFTRIEKLESFIPEKPFIPNNHSGNQSFEKNISNRNLSKLSTILAECSQNDTVHQMGKTIENSTSDFDIRSTTFTSSTCNQINNRVF